jgi:iron complex transport system ATP-binding protein
MSAPLLEARALTVTVPGRVLVEGFDLALGPGDFVGVLGGNGAGKSLLLRTLAGLRAPAAGRISLAGHDLASHERRAIARQLAFLPQDPDAPPQGGVRESVLLGRHAHLGFWDVFGEQDAARVTRALEVVSLGHLAARDLATLSGGEQRRAAIARVLVQQPSIYLLDEPTNHLDPSQQLAILEHLRALAREGVAVVASLHDPNLALRFADTVWLLAGDGRAQSVACADLAPAGLAALYGVEFAETQLAGRRFMAPA